MPYPVRQIPDRAPLSKILPYLAIVAGAAFLLLIAVFRSVLVPFPAALGFLLSMAATFGATPTRWSPGTTTARVW